MPVRRILTTNGVSQGAVQITVDEDYFSAVSRSNGSDVLSTPGTQILVVQDYADSSYLQIRIEIGPTNFFGDHEVTDIEGYYCGADQNDCPL